MTTRRPVHLALLALCGIAAGAFAQTIHQEVEPNNDKSEANAFQLAPGDGVTGVSTGNIPSFPDPQNPDYFLISTMPMPPGIYRHRMVLTSPTPGHGAHIRGRDQVETAPGMWPCDVGTPGPFDAVAQASQLVGTVRTSQWYGFGKSEQVYYRVNGNAGTTEPYTAILQTQQIIPEDIGTFQAGIITISTLDQGHSTDTDLWIYDSDLNAIPGYGNDNALPAGGAPTSSQGSWLRREYQAGEYYIAISNWNLASNQPSPCDDGRRNGLLLDYPDAVLNNSTAINLNMTMTITDSAGPVQIPIVKTEPFEIVWLKFTVTGGVQQGACCFSDGSCADLTESECLAQGGAFAGSGTTCTGTPCPQPAACCFPWGTCEMLLETMCSAEGGTFHAGADCTTAPCPPQPTDRIIPPPAFALPLEWAYGQDHTQVLQGGFEATRIRLQVDAAATGANAFQNDAVMRLESPTGVVLTIGAQNDPSLGIPHWHEPSLLIGGTPPGATNNAQSFDVSYAYNFGPVDGVWKVNFYNSWEFTGAIDWRSIVITPSVDDRGACCSAAQGCRIVTESECLATGDDYRGVGTRCDANADCEGWLIEDPDAGELMHEALEALGEGPLVGIQGRLTPDSGDIVDLFKISICDVQNFSATTVGGTGMDTIVALFDETGRGITMNIDEVGGTSFQSRITSQFVPAGGVYYLAISHFDRLPADSAGARIWIENSSVWRTERMPDGPGAANPLASWVNNIAGAGEEYRIYLTGACFLDAEPCYADCDGNQTLNIDDFLCYINEFAQAQSLPPAQQISHYANCDGSTTEPVLTIDDFLCFINEFAQGCP